MATQPFGLRFDEAIQYLRGKLPEASVRWDDLAGPVHGKVFTVAGATTADLARDIQDALVKGLESGQTLTAFRKDFDRIVQERGWSYNGKRGWRTAVIFDTNMRSAHMAGRWAQLQANKEARPFLQYRTAGDARVRKQHRQWDGKFYPVDDPFWSTHYPPNGWGCRCTVRAYSRAEMERKGLSQSEPFQVQTRDVVTRDGEITDRVPVGIDPGWDHNVGKSWITPELALGSKIARLPKELRGPVTDKTVSPAFQSAIEANWKAFQNSDKAAQGDAQILGFLDSAMLDGLEAVAAVELRGSAIAATADLSNAWPQDLTDRVPSLLRDYRAVLWDRQAAQLVVVPDAAQPAQGQAQVIRVTPNVKTKYGTAAVVTALEAAPTADLAAQRYQVIAGRVPR